ncbi:helix-turn-helix domain-containing protein [Streptomyces sp. NPDC015492]|uniref:helix-turn-helix domain-containing protein n=1 Tax=Streptomyces sp. NPDC015492 TaxID=3364958 RepID=UPI0036F62F2E
MSGIGRPEKPVDRTVPARGKLADFLRERKAEAELTYRQMAQLSHTKEPLSRATLERAASGTIVPSRDTVEAFVFMTVTKDEEISGRLRVTLHRSHELWVQARRATRAPYFVHKAPDASLVSSRADLSRALRRQHIWAGYPSPGEMARMSGTGELPTSTARRIITGDTLPVDPRQTTAFLKACYVLHPTDLEPWLRGAARAHKHGAAWTRAHQVMLQQIETEREADPPESSANATVVYLPRSADRLAA